MGKSLTQLETDLKNAQNLKSEGTDQFVNVMTSFHESASETYEVLDGMHSKMATLFKEVGKYFAFDTKKYGLEELFSDIHTFCQHFTVTYMYMYDVITY